MGDAAHRGPNTAQTRGGTCAAGVAAPRGHTQRAARRARRVTRSPRPAAGAAEVAVGPWGRALAYHC